MPSVEPGKPHRSDQRERTRLVRLRGQAPHLVLQKHIAEHGAPIQQQIALEHDADIGVGRPDRAAIDAHLAGRRLDQPGNDGEQRALAASARPEQRYELAGADGDVDAVDRERHRAVAREEGFRDAAKLNGGRPLTALDAVGALQHGVLFDPLGRGVKRSIRRARFFRTRLH